MKGFASLIQLSQRESFIGLDSVCYVNIYMISFCFLVRSISLFGLFTVCFAFSFCVLFMHLLRQLLSCFQNNILVLMFQIKEH